MNGLLIDICWKILLPNVKNESVYWVFPIFDELRYERERERWPGSITTEAYSLVREETPAINLI